MRNRIFAAAFALTLCSGALGGDHLVSTTIAYGGSNALFSSVNPMRVEVNKQMVDIPDGSAEWLSAYVESHCASGPNTWLRIWVRGTDKLSKGSTYYSKILRPCQSEVITFPFPVHTFHNLEAEAKCFNRNTRRAERCIGYLIMYGK